MQREKYGGITFCKPKDESKVCLILLEHMKDYFQNLLEERNNIRLAKVTFPIIGRNMYDTGIVGIGYAEAGDNIPPDVEVGTVIGWKMTIEVLDEEDTT